MDATGRPPRLLSLKSGPELKFIHNPCYQHNFRWFSWEMLRGLLGGRGSHFEKHRLNVQWLTIDITRTAMPLYSLWVPIILWTKTFILQTVIIIHIYTVIYIKHYRRFGRTLTLQDQSNFPRVEHKTMVCSAILLSVTELLTSRAESKL